MRLNGSATPALLGVKKAVNLSVNAALLEQAKALGIDLSRALEQHLVDLMQQKTEEAWQAENRAGIDAYNKLVATHGVFGDRWRPSSRRGSPGM